jgi:hypothetical protein
MRSGCTDAGRRRRWRGGPTGPYGEIYAHRRAKHPLMNEGYDGILVRAYFCLLQRNGSGVAGPRARLAFISWHALARMWQRSTVDIFTAKGVVAACGIAGYLLRESAKHANTEINYAAENMICTDRLRFAEAEGHQYSFYDVATVVCTENLIRIDCVTESPYVSGDDRSALALPGPVRLAVQVEEPTSGRERCTPTSADRIAAEGAWPRPAHE